MREGGRRREEGGKENLGRRMDGSTMKKLMKVRIAVPSSSFSSSFFPPSFFFISSMRLYA